MSLPIGPKRSCDLLEVTLGRIVTRIIRGPTLVVHRKGPGQTRGQGQKLSRWAHRKTAKDSTPFAVRRFPE